MLARIYAIRFYVELARGSLNQQRSWDQWLLRDLLRLILRLTPYLDHF